jgi:uncharacterized protein YbjT (DUF2867 family)
MKILVLGGTQFVGRAFVESALAAGDELTLPSTAAAGTPASTSRATSRGSSATPRPH